MTDLPGWPTFEEWRGALPPSDRAGVDALVALMTEAGAAEPEAWARSEASEDIAQAARYAFLRAVWRNVERWRDQDVIDRVIGDLEPSAGARQQVGALLAQAAFEATQDVLQVIDDGWDEDGPGGLPGWRLVELDAETEEPTGRDVASLHESLLQVDPLGIEASDIRGW